MKKLAITLVSCACVLAALALPRMSSAQLVFQTTFGHATFPDQQAATKGAGHHWEVSDYFNNDLPGPYNRPCLDSSCGINTFGGWYSNLGGPNQPTGDDVIHTNANNPNGGGGKGFRHWRGNNATGQNDNGGGILIDTGNPVNEFWIRFLMRFQAGFTWGPFGIANPGYTKDLRNESQNGWVFGIQGGASWGISWTGGNVTSSKTWQSTMGGPKGDGLWHCYEFHWQNGGSGSRIEMWVDDQQVLNTTASTPIDQTRSILLGSNQNAVGDSNGLSVNNGGTPTDWYTDYDDIAISTTGRIGCGNTFVLPAPRNLRFQ